ncbi:MAG: hypothetical protein JXR56_00310 [Candidatus Cloacimonetes bacterium]|nr:hypothetical protein [Candidatus Cloacimonadota bacterium]
MKRFAILLILATLTFGLPAVNMTEQVDQPDTLNIGTPIEILLSFSPPVDSASVEVPDTLTTFDFFGNQPIYQDDKLQGIMMTVAPFETGQLALPSMKVMSWSDEIPEQHETRHRIFMVQTVLPDSGAVLKDISGTLKVRLNFWDYLLIIGGIALLIAIIWLLTKIPRKDITKPTYRKPEVIIPAWEIALKSLEALKSAQLMQNGRFLDYYFELSSILRRFIEGYYNFNAAEMTTYEINDALSELDVEQRPEIKSFLLNCDMKKYAKQIPTMEDADNSYYWLYKYITGIKEIELKKAETIAGEEKKNV